jgi:hypothetical protein
VYLHRKATRGLRGSTSSAARMKGMTSGATERGTCCPASGATPAGSLRDTSVLANASHLRLGAAAAADDVDAPAVSITGSRTRDDDDGDGDYWRWRHARRPRRRFIRHRRFRRGEVRLRGRRGNTVFGFEHPASKQGMPALVGSPRQEAEHVTTWLSPLGLRFGAGKREIQAVRHRRSVSAPSVSVGSSSIRPSTLAHPPCR